MLENITDVEWDEMRHTVESRSRRGFGLMQCVLKVMRMDEFQSLTEEERKEIEQAWADGQDADEDDEPDEKTLRLEGAQPK